MNKNTTRTTMMVAGGLAATAAMTAAGMAAAKNSRKVKKMAKKVGRGAQQAVLDLDKASAVITAERAAVCAGPR